jgi:hypothetical protein
MNTTTPKNLPGTNTLAYCDTTWAGKKARFILLGPGVNVIKLFSFVADDKENKLECFVTGNHFPI